MSLPAKSKAAVLTGVSRDYDVIKYGDIETPQISSPYDVIIKNKYSGINLIESYFRKGISPVQFPYHMGREASGVVAAIGSEVTKFKVGDKVSYLSIGTFAQYTKVTSKKPQISILDKDVTDEQLKLFGSVLNQTLTSLTFIEEAHHVVAGEYILVWAAAGGVGSILTQLISNLGAHVIAVASSDEKLKLAKSLGAEYLINSSTDDIAAKALEITHGEGVAASFDSVGKDSFDVSYAALKRKGTFVSYGMSSGPIPPISVRSFVKNIKFVRPMVGDYVATSEEWDYYFAKFNQLVKQGKLQFDITRTYPLSEYAEATRALEHRETTGKLTLEIPQ